MPTRRDTIVGVAAILASARPALALPDPAVPGLRRAYLDGPFGQIHVRIAEPERRDRNTAPLVLLHQTPLSGRMFEKIMPYLARGRRVIAVDTPGYGESDRPAQRPDLVGYGDAILAALAPRFGKRFDWLGYHTGTVVAADLAVRRPASVRRLVLVSVPLFDDDRRTKLLAQLDAPDDAYSEDGSHLLPLWTGSAKVRPPAQSLDDVARLVAEKQRPGRYREWALRSAMAGDLATTLRAIAQPTLLIAPKDGLEGDTARAAALIRRSTLLSENLGYGLFDAAPDRLAKPIRDFLDQR